MNISSARKRTIARVADNSANDDFDQFWRNYPSRGGHANPRKPALEKFTAAVNRGVEPELLISAAANYAEQMRRNGTAGRFIKTAEVWLNKASWEQFGNLPDADPPVAGLI